MAEETKFNYWVVYSFLTPDGEMRQTGRFIERKRAIETHEDIKSLKAEGGFADLRALTPVYWTRMQ